LVFQQFCHALDAARLPHGDQFHGDSPGAIAASMLPEQITDHRNQFLIALVSRRLALTLPGVVASTAHGERVADSNHGKRSFQGELFNQGVDIGYALRLKMANAFFKMSRSRS